MDSLMCCMAGRHRSKTSNPLEGRVNLRLQGRQDYEKDPDQEPFDAPNFSGGSSSPSSSARRGGSGEQKHADVPSNGGANGHGSKKDSDASEDSDETEVAACAPERMTPIPSKPKEAPTAQLSSSSPSSNTNKSAEAPRTAAVGSNREAAPKPPDSPTRGRQADGLGSKGLQVPGGKKLSSSTDDGDKIDLQRQMEDLAKKLQKTIGKYPSSGKSFFNRALKSRFFAIKLNFSEANEPTSLCYWEDEASRRSEEALGVLPIATIISVEYKPETEKGLQVKVVTNTKDKKDVALALELHFATKEEARSWSRDLDKFIDIYKRWSPESGSMLFASVTSMNPNESASPSKGKDRSPSPTAEKGRGLFGRKK